MLAETAKYNMGHEHHERHEHHHGAHEHHHTEHHIHTPECGHIHVHEGSMCAKGICGHIEHMRAAMNDTYNQHVLNEEDEYETDPKTGKKKKKKKIGTFALSSVI